MTCWSVPAAPLAPGEHGAGIRPARWQLPTLRCSGQAILDLRLHRLTGLEQSKIFDEYKAILDIIADLLDILGIPTAS